MYSIEELMEQITEPKTRELFKEIYSLYSQEQYRATVVMLWTTIICDIIYKLQYLDSVYNDETANKILKEIHQTQKDKPTSPEWEKSLIDKIKDRTQLLTEIEKENLLFIQKQRNLCAHPVINDDTLFNPSKDLTRHLLRSALETMLTKHAFLSKNYVDVITDDFAQRQEDFFLDDEKAIRYFESKYLKHLTLKQIIKLFNKLWKFLFNANSENEKNHMYINEVLLSHILQKYKSDCINEISNNPDKYTYNNKDKQINNYFYNFLIRNSYIYSLLSEHTKSIIANEYATFPLNIPCYFIKNSFKEHIESLIAYMKNVINELKIAAPIQIFLLHEKAKEYDAVNLFYQFCILYYCNSTTFDDADKLFKILIYPYYKNFDLNELRLLINRSDCNNQTYDRRKAEDDHKLIAEQFVKKDGKREELTIRFSNWNVYLNNAFKKEEDSYEVPF